MPASDREKPTHVHAPHGARALDITWGDGNMQGQSDATILAAMKAALPPLVPALPGTIAIDAEFTWPAATAAPLEPDNAIADVRPDRAEIWSTLKVPIDAQQDIARALDRLADRLASAGKAGDEESRKLTG